MSKFHINKKGIPAPCKQKKERRNIDEFRKRGYLKNAGEQDAQQYVAEVSTAMKIETQSFFAPAKC